jgi:hypothetical protein
MPCPYCCLDADWNANPDRTPDLSALFTSVIAVAGKKVN